MSSFTPDPTGPNLEQPSNDEPRLLTRRDELPSITLQQQVSARNPRRSPARPRRKRLLARNILIACLALFFLTVAGVFYASISLRKSMRAALPQIDGALHTTGLSAPVTITRDDHGVPSIQAANLDDLLFAQGFVTAQDRLWQMDVLRRHGAGDLAEILGSNLVEHDRTQRTLQLRAAADRAIAVFPADQLHQLEAYARGVNAFITQNTDHLPVEFHLLHYTPVPWTPRDTILVLMSMAQDLSTEYPTKLDREAFSAHMPSELLPDLYPVGSWRDHPPTQPPTDLTSPRPEIEQIPLDESQSKLDPPTATPHDLLAARASLSLQTCEGCRSGSNNWAVAGSRSATGMPLVSNDMHLGLNVPDIWYEASLHTTDSALDVTGLTLPGAPFVIVGRNAHVAWGFTNLGADVQDVYIEHLRGTGPSTEYQRSDGTWVPVEHHIEHIIVRAGRDITLDVLTTTHNIGAAQMTTPIISPLYPSEHRALSLAWTPYDPATVTAPFFAVNAATDGASLAAAFSTFGGPSLNLVYADDHNHIGYHAIGRIPIRGPAVHHPVVVAPPPTPATGDGPPANEDESVLPCSTVPFVFRCRPEPSVSGSPTLIAAAYRPRRTRHAQPFTPTPQPKEEPLLVPTPPLGYTIGSPIPAVPVDVLDPNAQWSGYIPYAELPNITDPSTGFLATANARISANDYPYALALDWASPYRVERISHLLAKGTGLTSADMLHMQMDVHSELDLALAQRMAYALDHAAATSHDAKRLHQAADILRRWNGDVTVDAAAPAIVSATRPELWSMLLVPKVKAHDKKAGSKEKPEAIADLYSWGEQGYVLEQLVLHTPARWLPPGFANWNDLLATAVSRGLTTAHAPADLTTWSYSKAHPVTIKHPVLSMSPLFSRILGVKVDSGPRVVGGDTSTIKATSRAFGPTERFTADLSSANATTSNITTGQSGNPASPWYLDQLPHWLNGTTFNLPLHDAPTMHTLILQP